MKILKRTKIITTIGPVSENLETMTKLFHSGMTTIRLNFSHGSYEEQGNRIKLAKEISKKEGFPISVMLDTKGPEIRIGKFKNGTETIEKGQKVTIHCSKELFLTKECAKGEMTVEYDMSKDLSAGKQILIDDGKLLLITETVGSGVVTAVAQNTHVVKANKRVNLPGTKFSMPFLSEKDVKDIEFGCDMEVDYIAASFANSREDIEQIRAILKRKNAEHIQIIAKIESQYAVDHIDEIIDASDAIMVARGDLGLEIPFFEVPVAQRMMIEKCNAVGKPVIVATQMLDSMEKTPLPTRAEVTDVFMATEQGADATMLSGESAAGQYPVDAVSVMATINARAEKEIYCHCNAKARLATATKLAKGANGKLALQLTKMASKGAHKFAVVISKDGSLLKEIAKLRPNTNVLGVTNNAKVASAFGITSTVYMSPDLTAADAIHRDINEAKKVATSFDGVAGDKVLVLINGKVKEVTL